MLTDAVVRRNAYYDSVTLMAISKSVVDLEGVIDAVVSMGTDNNKALLENAGLWSPAVDTAGPNDLVIAYRVADEATAERVQREVEAALSKKGREGQGASEVAPASIVARRRVGSTCAAFIRDRSTTSPSSQTALPAMLCPPPRTASTSPLSRAKPTARTTSAVAAQRAMTAGRLSIIAFQIVRASS